MMLLLVEMRRHNTILVTSVALLICAICVTSAEDIVTPEATAVPSEENTVTPVATAVPSEENTVTPVATAVPSEKDTVTPVATAVPSEKDTVTPVATAVPSVKDTVTPVETTKAAVQDIVTAALIPSACKSNPCKNGGRCEADGNSYKCICIPTKSTIDENCSRCSRVHCRNHGKCVESNYNWRCICLPGTGGSTCHRFRNLAHLKEVYASSFYKAKMNADKAVDGVIAKGNMYSGNCFHSAQEDRPWWQINLGREYAIRKVYIYNRQDCCAERLNNFSIYGYTYKDSKVCVYYVGYFKDSTVVTDCPRSPNMVAQRIRIQIRASNAFLQLCEVRVYGIAWPESKGVAYQTMEKLSEDENEVQATKDPEMYNAGKHVGVALGVIIPVVAIAVFTAQRVYKKRQHRKNQI